MHPITLLALVLVAAVALTQVPGRVPSPDLLSADALPVAALPLDALRVAAAPAPLDAGVVATPNHDPLRVRRVPPAVVETAATPNHDARPLSPLPSLALNPSLLRAEPEPAAPSAPDFVGTDTVLYAKGGARLRAAPATAAEILAKLAVDTPLRAVARSSDDAWWRVALSGGRVGYVHRTAVTQSRAAKPAPPAASSPVVAAAAPQPAPARRSQSFRGYVDETMNWFIDAAAHGTAPTVIRTER